MVAHAPQSIPYLQKRLFESLSYDILQAIRLITLDPKYPPKLVGSFQYAIHEYPADIDMFEQYETKGKPENVASDLAARFRRMVASIYERPLTYLGDFKAGKDERFDIPIGEYKQRKVVGYRPSFITKKMHDLYDQGLLDKDELAEWLRLVKPQPTLDDFLELEKAIHNKIVVRWNKQDMELGYKVLPGNVKLNLEEALQQKSVVKIDIWVYLNGRYMEMTNMFHIVLRNPSKPFHIMTVPLKNYEQSLLHDILHYNDPLMKKQMKLAKRIWTYAAYKKKESLLRKLYPLFSSPAAKMYQIVGEADTMSNMISSLPQIANTTSFRNSAQEWKIRLGTIMPDVLPSPVMLKVFKKIDVFVKTRDAEYKPELLGYIADRLEYYINKYVQRYLKRKQIYPWKVVKSASRALPNKPRDS